MVCHYYATRRERLRRENGAQFSGLGRRRRFYKAVTHWWNVLFPWATGMTETCTGSTLYHINPKVASLFCGGEHSENSVAVVLVDQLFYGKRFGVEQRFSTSFQSRSIIHSAIDDI